MEDIKRGRKTSPSNRNRSRSSKLFHLCKLRNLVVCILALTLGAFFFLSLSQADVQLESKSPKMTLEEQASFWKNLDLSKEQLPANIDTKNVQVTVDKVTIKDVPVTYRSAIPPTGVQSTSQILFLLHGAAFTSRTWVEQVPTVQTLATLGYKVFAVDLPGYGDTPDFNGDRGEFLENLIKQLCGDSKPVLVSPSMSGTFSLPLLERNQDAISGFIPVAPVGTGSYSESFYKSVNVPTMIVYGEKDYGLGRESKKNLEQIPTSTQPQELAEARHPAYLDQPQKWHQLIYNFMKALA